jgi:hypothetical protein
MATQQPTPDEAAATRTAFRDLGIANRVRITTEDDGPDWKAGDEARLLQRPPLPQGTDATTIQGTNAWNSKCCG